MEPKLPEICTPDEAAQLLRVDDSTIRRWVDKGELAGMRIGATVRVSCADIRRRLRERRGPKVDPTSTWPT